MRCWLITLTIFSSLTLGQEKLTSENAPKTILFWNTEQKLEGFGNLKEILPTRQVSKSQNFYPFRYDLLDLSNLKYKFKGEEFSLEDFIQTFKIAGLIVIRDGVILYESYDFGNDETTKWVSFSVTKSVTSMLLGAAIKDGHIKSVEDKVTIYLPQLLNSNYQDVSIKQVLQMSSGIDWNEDYEDPLSDVNIAGALNSLNLYEYLNNLNKKSSAGNKFNYNTGETNLIGGIVRAAIGDNLSNYLEKKIWKPFGMEFNAYWVIDTDYEQELGGCCLNATLRDYARLGMFAMNNGKLNNGVEILPKNWMKDSTTPSRNNSYYGYQWWLDGPAYQSFYADGIFGQFIWIDPVSKTVVAMHAARDRADVDSFVGGHRLNFMVSLIEAIK